MTIPIKTNYIYNEFFDHNALGVSEKEKLEKSPRTLPFLSDVRMCVLFTAKTDMWILHNSSSAHFSTVAWPPRTSDLSPLDFLWKAMKSLGTLQRTRCKHPSCSGLHQFYEMVGCASLASIAGELYNDTPFFWS